LNLHPPDTGLAEAEIAAFVGFWQRQTLDMGSRAPKPATLARRALEMLISLRSRRTSPLGFERTQNNEAAVAWRGVPWQCCGIRLNYSILAARQATSLSRMDFAVRAACSSLKEDKVMLPAQGPAAAP
jgi:hypothetical protein